VVTPWAFGHFLLRSQGIFALPVGKDSTQRSVQFSGAGSAGEKPNGPPIAWFASAMGLASLGLAWRAAGATVRVPSQIGETILAVAALVFATLATLYVRKALRSPESVRKEYADPIVSSYFGTVTISLSLLAAALIPYARSAGTILWALSATASLALLLLLLRRWVATRHDLAHITPAWFIPIVGNAVSVYAAVALGFIEVGWFLFAAALLCWLTLQPLVFYRLIFHDAIPPRLTPSLAILVSSPAVLASAWFALEGGAADPFFRILAFKALFLALLVVMLTKVTRRAPFSAAWWGYTFPAAALAGAFERYAEALRTPFASGIGWTILVAATTIVAYVSLRAVLAYARHLFHPVAL